MNVKKKVSCINALNGDNLDKLQKINENFNALSLYRGLDVQVPNSNEFHFDATTTLVVEKKIKYRSKNTNNAFSRKTDTDKVKNCVKLTKFAAETAHRTEITSKIRDILKEYANNFKETEDLFLKRKALSKKINQEIEAYSQVLDVFKEDLIKKYEAERQNSEQREKDLSPKKIDLGKETQHLARNAWQNFLKCHFPRMNEIEKDYILCRGELVQKLLDYGEKFDIRDKQEVEELYEIQEKVNKNISLGEEKYIEVRESAIKDNIEKTNEIALLSDKRKIYQALFYSKLLCLPGLKDNFLNEFNDINEKYEKVCNDNKIVSERLDFLDMKRFERIFNEIEKGTLSSDKLIFNYIDKVEKYCEKKGFDKTPFGRLKSEFEGKSKIYEREREDIKKFFANLKLSVDKNAEQKNKTLNRTNIFSLAGADLGKLKQFETVFFEAEFEKILHLKKGDFDKLSGLHEKLLKMQSELQNVDIKVKNNKKNDDINIIVQALIPYIIDAAKSEIFDENFVAELCKIIDDLGSSNEDLKDFRQTLNRVYTTSGFLSEFVKVIKKLKNENLRDDCELFIYNVLRCPYQRAGEGSCFAAAIWMKIWHDKFFEFMQIVAGIIKSNRLHFDKIFPEMNPKFILVKKYGAESDKYDRIYQKLVSPVASLLFKTGFFQNSSGHRLKSFRKDVANIFINNIEGIDANVRASANSITYKNSDLFANNLITKNTIHWKDGQWKIKATEKGLVEKIKEAHKKLLGCVAFSFKKNLSEAQYQILASSIIKNFDNKREGGGSTGDILRILGGESDKYTALTYVNIESDDKCVFKISDFQRLLDNLKQIYCQNGSKKIIKGQFLLAEYRHKKFSESGGKLSGGHAFNFIPTDVKIVDMNIGEKSLIGDLNYSKFSHVYAKKMDNEYVQVVKSSSADSCEDVPVTRDISGFKLYHTFFVNCV